MAEIKINTKNDGTIDTIYQNNQLIYGTVTPPQPTFNLDSYMDLCNLQSTDLTKFNLSGNKIIDWTEQDNITKWSQATDSRRPTLVNGVPTFSGANTSLLRSQNLSLTNYSLYCVVQNAGKGDSKAIFSTLSTLDERFSFSTGRNQAILKFNGGNSWLGHIATTGNRDCVIGIRVTPTTVKVTVNDRIVMIKTFTYSGQSTNIGVLMGLVNNASWSMNGNLKAFCVSSQQVDETTHAQIVDALYSRYNLASNTSIDSVLVIGDSNIAGSGSATAFPIALGSQLGLSVANLGISGALLTPLAGTTANSVFNRQNQLISKPFKDWVIIWAGTNDLIYNVTANDYENYLSQILSNFQSKGYDMQKVIVCTPPYQKDNARETELNDYRTKINTLSNTYGNKVYDVLQMMRDNGGNSLMLDSVHLNQTAQNLVQQGLFNLMTT